MKINMKIHTKILVRSGALALCVLSTPVVSIASSQTSSSGVLPMTMVKAKEKTAEINKALAWTEWELTAPAYAGLKKAPFLKFTDTRLSASVGLNSMFGNYQLDGRKMTVHALASTMMGGPESLMNAETLYRQALQETRNFHLSRDGKNLKLYGAKTLSFRWTGRTAQGFAPAETKIINVAPELGPQMDGDKTPEYLQLEDLSEGTSWGRFSEAQIMGFDFVPGNRYQLRVVVERDARSGEKRLRLLNIFSQQWMPKVTLEADQKIFEVAPVKVDCVRVAPMKCLQVREMGGQWTAFHAPIKGFDFQEGWRYRLQVAVTKVENPPADASSLRYVLVRVLDKMPVTY